MNLHRAEKVGDWEQIPHEKRNRWQKIAAKTKGIITPANFITLTGGVLVIDGLYDFAFGDKKMGVAKIIFGRALDVADGYVADKTGTKSPLGEAFDVTVDKIALATALPVLVDKDIIPMASGIMIGAQNLANIAITGIAKSRGNEIHSSRLGKNTTFGQWAAIGLYTIGSTSSHELSQSIEDSANVITYASTAIGFFATSGYVRVLQPAPQEVPRSKTCED